MGHYDSQYEASEREDRARSAREAKVRARQKGIGVLKPTTFKPLGVCGKCAITVYSIPNWDCNNLNCPHKP